MEIVEADMTQDVSSGVIHRRVKLGDQYMTFEGDNLDEAGEFIVIKDETEAKQPYRFCKRCFPKHV